jgi:hypothetical protein
LNKIRILKINYPSCSIFRQDFFIHQAGFGNVSLFLPLSKRLSGRPKLTIKPIFKKRLRKTGIKSWPTRCRMAFNVEVLRKRAVKDGSERPFFCWLKFAKRGGLDGAGWVL